MCDTICRLDGLLWSIIQPNGEGESLPKHLYRITAGLNKDMHVWMYEKVGYRIKFNCHTRDLGLSLWKSKFTKSSLIVNTKLVAYCQRHLGIPFFFANVRQSNNTGVKLPLQLEDSLLNNSFENVYLLNSH